MKIFGICAAGVIAIFAIGWIGMANDLAMFSFFAPKYEQVRRTTFEQSKAYNQGMIQNLQQAQQEYTLATDDQKAALVSILRHRFADYPEENLPPYLQSFLHTLRQ